MCCRYTFYAPWEDVRESFQVEKFEGEWNPRYNAAPSQHLPIIVSDDPKIVVLGKWGIKPAWAKDTSKRLNNARAESLATKASFTQSANERRCIILANGFYEWGEVGQGPKQPFHVVLKNGALFGMAGIFELDKKEGRQFAIITTAPNSLIGQIHNRMPAILTREGVQAWLDASAPFDQVANLLRPYPARQMKAYPVSLAVNSSKNDNPDIIKPFKPPLAP